MVDEGSLCSELIAEYSLLIATIHFVSTKEPNWQETDVVFGVYKQIFLSFCNVSILWSGSLQV